MHTYHASCRLIPTTDLHESTRSLPQQQLMPPIPKKVPFAATSRKTGLSGQVKYRRKQTTGFSYATR